MDHSTSRSLFIGSATTVDAKVSAAVGEDFEKF